MPTENKKRPPKLSLVQSEGVEVTKKFATAKVIKWGLIIYLFFMFRSCINPPNYQQQNNVKPKAQVVEQMLPSSIERYDASKLTFKKGYAWEGTEVYKDGVPLGFLGEVNILKDKNDKVVGYLNNSGVYNLLGERTGKLYKGDITDLYGNVIGSLKSNGNSLESIIDKSSKELAKIKEGSYVVIAKEPSSSDYKIIGLVDGYKTYSKEVLKEEKELIHHD